MATNRKLLRRLALTRELPTLPQVVHLALSTIQSSRSGADQVADVIAEDLAMTSQLLRVANSVIYNPTLEKITSVPIAVSRIGFDEVHKMIIAVGVIDLFRKTHGRFNYRRYWRHSIAAGLLSDIVADAANLSDSTLLPGQELMFVGGLLHDIGMLPLAEQLANRYARVVQAYGRKDVLLESLEAKRLGVTHTEIGGELIRRWKISDAVAEAAACHHHPERAPEAQRSYVRIVHVADWIADSLGYGIVKRPHTQPLQDEVWCKLALSADDLPKLTKRFEHAADESKLFLVLNKA